MFHVPARPLSGLHPFDAHLPGMVACSGYHRFTLPRRDTVMVATCVPRRNTTLVLDHPHARPIGSKTTTGVPTPPAPPIRPGPGPPCKAFPTLSPPPATPSASAASTPPAP